jgi:putative lipoic acid-binding regulatory protein|tara:strand:- start:973 stop:1245 length:273 start_codon:yes stop_codon:yes gene_type:complete
MEQTEKESLLKFPCNFDIKVMGESVESFSESMIKIIKKQDENFNESRIEMKGSSNGKYISLTCNVYVTSQEQLDKIYMDLSKNPMTKFVL